MTGDTDLQRDLAAALARAERAEAERDETRALVANFVDQAEYSDSYGGSNFVACYYCRGGGAPNVPMDHEADCPAGKAKIEAARWWGEFQEETNRAEVAESALAAALARNEEMAAALGFDRQDGRVNESHACYNLEGALYDLERLGADAICVRTIRRVCEQLAAAARVLEENRRGTADG